MHGSQIGSYAVISCNEAKFDTSMYCANFNDFCTCQSIVRYSLYANPGTVISIICTVIYYIDTSSLNTIDRMLLLYNILSIESNDNKKYK